MTKEIPRRRRSPSFQFYPGDWLSSPGVNAMSPEEEGYYIRLLSYCWQDEDCSLPSDPIALGRLARVPNLDRTNVERTLTYVRRMFVEHPEHRSRLTHRKLYNEMLEQSEYYRKKVESGQRSGQARRRKRRQEAEERSRNERRTNVEHTSNERRTNDELLRARSPSPSCTPTGTNVPSGVVPPDPPSGGKATEVAVEVPTEKLVKDPHRELRSLVLRRVREITHDHPATDVDGKEFSKQFRARVRERAQRLKPEWWEEIFLAEVQRSTYLRRESNCDHVPTLSWMLRPKNFELVINGEYRDKGKRYEGLSQRGQRIGAAVEAFLADGEGDDASE